MDNLIPEKELDSLTEIIGIRVRALRHKKDWTQEKLGFLSDSSQNTIKKIEAGSNNPSISILYRVAKALNVNLTDILEPDMSKNQWLTKEESEKLRILSNDLRNLRDDLGRNDTVEGLQEIQFELDGIESAVRVRQERIKP